MALNLVLISATPSLIPATLCNIGEFKNSLQLKWFGFFFYLEEEPDLLIRFTEHGCSNSCAGAMKGVAASQPCRDRQGWRSRGQQWTRTNACWRIPLESHSPSTSSFSASAPSPRWFLVLLGRFLTIPYGATCLGICLFLDSLHADFGGDLFSKPSQTTYLQSIWGELFTGSTIPIFIQISHQPGTCDESQTDFSLSCWMSLKRKFMVFEVSAVN